MGNMGPMKDTTRQDYGARIARVASHIAEHPDGEHGLGQLAAIACFSPWHFHRIYRAIMGETVADTVRRVRLHRAAATLVRSAAPIAEIARQAGYGSAEAFTRAFASAHGVTPSVYRTRGVLHPLAGVAPDQEGSLMYDVQTKNLPALSVAALRHNGPYLEIGATFERLFAWASARNLIGPLAATGECRMLGVYYDDPDSVPPSQYRSDACLAIAPEQPVDGTVRRIEIAGGRYACIVHKGPYAELEKAYRWLFATWLPDSGHEPADQPVVEEYLNNPREHPPSDWLTEIRLALNDGALKSGERV